jgi:chemotaxis protein MotD
MTIGINQTPAALTSIATTPGKSNAKTRDGDVTFGSVVGFSKPGAKGKGGEMASSPAIGFPNSEKRVQQKNTIAAPEDNQARWLRPNAPFDKVVDGEFSLQTEQSDTEEPLPDDATPDRLTKTSGDPFSAMMITNRLEGRGNQHGEGKAGSAGSGAPTVPSDRESATPKIPVDGDAASLAEAARTARGADGKDPNANVANFRLPGQVSGETVTGSIVRTDAKPDTKNAAKSAAASLTVSLSQATVAGEAAAEPATSSIGDDLRQSLEGGNRDRQQADTSGRRPDGKAERVTVVAQQNIPAPVVQSPISTASALATQIASDTGWREAAAPSFRPLAAQPNLSSAHTLKIQLNPAELGMVTANMRFSGEQLTVEIQVENGDAYRRLSADSETIVKSLRAIGLDVDRVTIQQPQIASQSVVRADSGATASGFAPRDQQSFGSAGSGGNGHASGGQQSARNNNDGAYGTSDAASTSSDRAGGDLYI